jgi:hypothetical protein
MNLKNDKYLYYLWGFLLAFIGTTFFSGLIVKLHANCHHATDFSIYQEAIYKIAAFGDFNPFLYVRNVNIFNDHFDPIILRFLVTMQKTYYFLNICGLFHYLFLFGLKKI